MSWTSRRCFIFALTVTLAAVSFGRSDRLLASDDASLRELKAQWAHQRNAVKSGRIKGSYILFVNTGRVVDGCSTEFSAKELDVLLQRIELAAKESVAKVRETVNVFPIVNSSHQRNPPWRFKLRWSQRKFRNSTYTASGNLEKEACFDGEHAFAYYPQYNGQLNVGVSELFKLSDLLTVPSRAVGKLERTSPRMWTLVSDGTGQSAESRASLKQVMEIDSATGTVLKWMLLVNDRKMRTIHHFRPVDVGDGIYFPLVSVRVRYQSDGSVQSIRIMCIQQHEFNVPIDDGEFRMEVPAGTTIVDYRESRQNPKTRKYPVAVDDAAKLLDANVTPLEPGVILIEP